MKKILILLAIVFGFVGNALAEGNLVFCEGINENFEPQKAGNSFPGPTVNLILTDDKPFGVETITATLYKQEGAEEAILERSSFDVNPNWTAYAIRNMPMPGPGVYALGFTRPGGETIAHASVTITGAQDEKPAKPQETMGGTLEKVFNKYAPKKQ